MIEGSRFVESQLAHLDLCRLPGGIAIAAVFNGNVTAGAFWNELQTTTSSLTEEIALWPAHDLSPRYYLPDAPAFPHTGIVNAASLAAGPLPPARSSPSSESGWGRHARPGRF